MTASKLKKRTYKKGTEKAPDPEKDYLDIFREHKQKIITLSSVLVIIIISIIIYLYWSAKSEDSAWVKFSTFVTESQVIDNVNDSKVQETLNTIMGSTAEPWFLFYCSSLYLDRREYDKALDMVTKLEKNFPSHLLVKEKTLVTRLKDAIKEEKKWTSLLQAQIDAPLDVMDNHNPESLDLKNGTSENSNKQTMEKR